MIVTCPGCSSKYRVRNEAVPVDGARMRCPKCDTLFLAKPPAGGGAEHAPIADEPSALYQQLNPATAGGNTAAANAPSAVLSPFHPSSVRPPQQAQQPQQPQAPLGVPQPAFGQPPPQSQPSPFGLAPQQAQPSPFGFVQAQQAQPQQASPQPAAGPITALFKAFDPASLPPEAQRPVTQPPLRDLSSGAPSGLSLDDGPKARVPLGSLPGPNATPRTPSSLSSSATQLGRPRARAPALQVSGSWAALVVGIAVAACGVTFAAWTTESANLDAALMPTFEHSFGIEPPHSTMGRGDSSAEELRSAATQAQADGDFPRAVVLWRRVKLRDATDPRALQLIPKLLSDLGDQGAP